MSTVDRLQPPVSVSVEAVVVSVDGSGESRSRRSTWKAALLTDGSVDMPHVSVSVDAAVVSVDGSGESWSRRSTWKQLSSPTALSTVDQLPLRVSVSVEAAVVSVDGSGESCS